MMKAVRRRRSRHLRQRRSRWFPARRRATAIVRAVRAGGASARSANPDQSVHAAQQEQDWRSQHPRGPSAPVGCREKNSPMKSGWVDSEAQAAIERYARQGVGRDLALRVYTTRLLGRDPKLVLHGGGNTSVKTTLLDLLGETVEVLCVKGSGCDMAVIEPAGLPAVRLDRLRKLRTRAALSDEEMVRIQRESLLEPTAPNPSVETLLHAFLPHKFVDHTHASAILSIADQPDGEAICAELYDGRSEEHTSELQSRQYLVCRLLL